MNRSGPPRAAPPGRVRERAGANGEAFDEQMQKKLVTLALQGGGSHGAFTWGVLDRLLEDDRIEIEAISGASAGAMNAARDR